MTDTDLSREDIDLIRDTSLHLSVDLTHAGEVLYETLFEMDPAIRPLFLQGMTAQAGTLMSTLGLVVSQLQNMEALEPVIRDLALRHLAYGVEARHYDLAGAALIDMLRSVLDPRISAVAVDAWGRAYGRLAGAMLAVAHPEERAQ